jgi:hypothetical protein
MKGLAIRIHSTNSIIEPVSDLVERYTVYTTGKNKLYQKPALVGRSPKPSCFPF